MAVKTYTATTTRGDTITFTGDFSQASSPISIVDEDGNEHATQWQVADFCHDPERCAVQLVADGGCDYWLSPDAEITEDEDGEELFDGMTEDDYIASLIKSVD